MGTQCGDFSKLCVGVEASKADKRSECMVHNGFWGLFQLKRAETWNMFLGLLNIRTIHPFSVHTYPCRVGRGAVPVSSSRWARDWTGYQSLTVNVRHVSTFRASGPFYQILIWRGKSAGLVLSALVSLRHCSFKEFATTSAYHDHFSSEWCHWSP